MLRLSTYIVVAGFFAAVLNGCANSGTSSGNGYIAPYSYSVQSCSNTGNASTSQCIPNLGNYGTDVVYEGSPVAITNTQVAKSYFQSFPGFQYLPIDSGTIRYSTSIRIELLATNNGPDVFLTLYMAGVPLTGYTQFFPTTNNGNPNVGKLTMNSATYSAMPLNVISLQPWDGSVPFMAAVTLTIGSGQPFGTVGLRRVQ